MHVLFTVCIELIGQHSYTIHLVGAMIKVSDGISIKHKWLLVHLPFTTALHLIDWFHSYDHLSKYQRW